MRIGRIARFSGGYLIGLLVLPLCIFGFFGEVLGVWWLSELGSVPGTRPQPSAVFESSGAEVSTAGGASVRFRKGKDLAEQACRGTCDDVALTGWGGQVEVRDAAGKTLLARKGWWPHGALGRDPRSGGLAVYDRSRS